MALWVPVAKPDDLSSNPSTMGWKEIVLSLPSAKAQRTSKCEK